MDEVATATELGELRAKVSGLRDALRPFVACVVADNGDVTIDTSRLHQADWLIARARMQDCQ